MTSMVRLQRQGDLAVVQIDHPPVNALSNALRAEISRRNMQLLNYKRLGGYAIWDQDFPRTASMKIKRLVLAEQIRERFDRRAMVAL